MKIDIVRSALMGYKTIWKEKEYVFKLCLVPVFVKFFCTIMVYVAEVEMLSVRHVLFMLPAFFVQGWATAQFLRTLLTGERWPIKISTPPSQAELAGVLLRARGILACLLSFTLIVMLQSGLALFLMDVREMIAVSPPTEPLATRSIPLFFMSIALMIGSVWAFRLMWLYIPLVILAPIAGFLKEIRGLITSVYMIGVWLMASVPVMFLMMLLSSLFLGETENVTTLSLFGFISIFIHVVGEILVQIITVTAMAYAFKTILIGFGATPIFKEPERPF